MNSSSSREFLTNRTNKCLKQNGNFWEPSTCFFFHSFGAVLGFQQNWEIGGFPTEISRVFSCPHTCIASSIINVTHHNDIFFFLPKMTILTHHNYPESIVFSLGLTGSVVHFLSFDKLCSNIIYYNIWHHTECFSLC